MIFNKEAKNMQYMYVGKLHTHRKKIEIGPMKDLNIISETVKLPEENTLLLDTGVGNTVFRNNNKSLGSKSKNRQMGLH